MNKKNHTLSCTQICRIEKRNQWPLIRMFLDTVDRDFRCSEYLSQEDDYIRIDDIYNIKGLVIKSIIFKERPANEIDLYDKIQDYYDRRHMFTRRGFDKMTRKEIAEVVCKDYIVMNAEFSYEVEV